MSSGTSSGMASAEKLSNDLLFKIYKDYLDDKTSLRAAIYVNRRWFKILTKLLWKRAPKSALHTVDALPDRQFYAESITKIRNLNGIDHQNHEGLAFKSLKSLNVRIDETLRLDSFRPYLQAGLQFIRFSGHAHFTTEICDTLKKCTNLSSLVFMGTLSTSDTTTLLDLFRGLKHLRRLHFEYPVILLSEHDHSGDIFPKICAGIFDHSTVQRLFIRHNLAPDFGQQIQDNMVSIVPLNKVSTLRLQGPVGCVAPVLSVVMNTLRSLDLRVTTDNDGSACASIGRLHNLSFLVLQFPSDTKIEECDLDAIGNLSGLHHLWLTTSRDMPEYTLAIEWLQDGFFAAWLMKFRDLRDIRLHWQCPALTKQSFIDIATQFPQMRSCEFTWCLDLGAWKDLAEISALMPRLRDLHISGVEGFSTVRLDADECDPVAQKHIETLRSVAPHVQLFQARGRTNETLSLSDAFSPFVGPLEYDSMYEE